MKKLNADPNIWGPQMWNLLFTLSFNVNGTNISTFKNVLRLLEHLLPCSKCRESYILYKSRIDRELKISDRSTAVKWLWTCKDMVNQKLAKETIDLQTVHNKYNIYKYIISDIEIMHLLNLMVIYFHKMNKKQDKMKEFINIVMLLLQQHPNKYLIAETYDEIDKDDCTLIKSMLTVYNIICTFYTESTCENEDTFIHFYDIAFVN